MGGAREGIPFKKQCKLWNIKRIQNTLYLELQTLCSYSEFKPAGTTKIE